MSIEVLDHTLRLSELEEKIIYDDEIIFTSGVDLEERARQPLWGEIASRNLGRVVYLDSIGDESCELSIDGTITSNLQLRDLEGIGRVIGGRPLLLDITGLSHDVWAPIVRYLKMEKCPFRVAYSEPEEYSVNLAPSSENIFDLSLNVEGVKPLPGFAKFADADDYDSQLLVSLLGFEGDRPLRIVLEFDPIPKVIPVVGVPGFQLNYPSYTVSCNRKFIREYFLHSQVRYARASCPFSLYDSLQQIMVDNPRSYMNIAMVGTKPHALGAVIFALDNEGSTELIFDHPVKKPGRSSGVGTIHIYHFA